MHKLNDDCLTLIFKKLSLIENIRIESVCKRWNRILKRATIYSFMKKLNVSEYLTGRDPKKYFNEKQSDESVSLDHRIYEILVRSGQFIQEITFDSRWLTATQPIIDHITQYCKNLKKLDLGCVVMDANITPLLDAVGEQLEELVIDETRWTRDENGEKFSECLGKLKSLRKINLRKFEYSLDGIVGLPDSMRAADLSDAAELAPEILVEFLQRQTTLENLVLSPMPPLCSRLFSTSTTTTINQADPFLGFVKRNYEKKRRILEGFKEERKVDGALKSSNKADLQSIFNTLEKLQSLRSLSLGYIGYSAQFLTMTPISQLENLRILNITNCGALNTEVLRASLKNLKNLRSLTLQNCPRIEDHTSVALCKELTSLEIENNGNFSDADLEKISQNKAIKWLKIRQCPRITDSGIKMATQNCPLKELDLSKCENITENLFSHREAFSQRKMEILSVRGCHAMTNNTISQMMDVLNLDNLREIDVSINKNIDDSSVRRIHSALLKSERPDKSLTIYAHNTGITREIQGEVSPHIELIF